MNGLEMMLWLVVIGICVALAISEYFEKDDE